MTEFILDASVALAWFLDNPVPAYALHVQNALRTGKNATVPALWHLEVANVLSVAGRRRLLTSDAISFALAQIEQLTAHSIQSHNNEFISARTALSTARGFRLSAYDGVYLETARTLGLPLATLDKSLQAAASQAGIKLFR